MYCLSGLVCLSTVWSEYYPFMFAGMAASALNPLEEYMTCSVCLEMFTNPHTLSCLHTYCYPCIQGIKVGQRVKCPDCREYTDIHSIKKDFKVQALIDHQQQVGKSLHGVDEAPRSTSCEVCQGVDRHVVSFCTQCDELLCSCCDQAHRGSRASKHHQINTFSDVACLRDSKFITKINQSRQDFKCKIDHYHDECIDQVKFLQDQHMKSVESAEASDKVDADVASHKILCDRILPEMIEALHKVYESTEAQLKQVAADLHKYDVHSVSETTQDNTNTGNTEKSESLPNSSVRTEAEQMIPCTASLVSKKLDEERSPSINKHMQTTFRSLLGKTQTDKKVIHKKYELVKTVDIPAWPHKLCLVRDELWMAADGNGVYVYSANLKLLQHIKCLHFKRVTGLVKMMSGTLLVCDSVTGIHLLSKNGHFLSSIVKGAFSDIVMIGQLVYALEFSKCMVYVFIEESPICWQQVHRVHLTHSNGSVFDKMAVHDNYLYISCWDSNTLYVYTTSGEYIDGTGGLGSGNPGKFKCLHVSDVDKSGNVLVCDRVNNRLQAFYAETRQWKEVCVLNDIKNPVSAVLNHKHMWVGTGFQKKLLLYKCKA